MVTIGQASADSVGSNLGYDVLIRKIQQLNFKTTDKCQWLHIKHIDTSLHMKFKNPIP